MSSSKYSAELFLEACGGAGPLQLSVEDATRPGAIRRVFHQPFLVVGRAPNADLLLDNWRVSRRHAYIQLVAGRLFCLDLGSRTGVQWSDGVDEAGWLDHGRSIRIGPYEISRWMPEANRAGSDLALALAGGPYRGTFRIEPAPQDPAPAPFLIDQDLAMVGRSPGCRVRLPYPDVSQAHGSLVRTPLGVWAVDLLGRGGIHVNESHVRFARLDEGDELRIGRHILRLDVVEDDSASDPPALHSGDHPLTPNIPRPARRLPVVPAPPSSTLPMAPTWHYPDGEVQRILADGPASQADLIGRLMQPMVQQFGLMQQQMFEQFHQAMMGMFQQFGAFYRDQMSELREELDEVRRLTQELQSLRDQARLPSPASPAPATAPAPGANGTGGPAVEEPTARRPPPTKSDAGVHNLIFDRIALLQTERQTRWQKILGMINRSGDRGA